MRLQGSGERTVPAWPYLLLAASLLLLPACGGKPQSSKQSQVVVTVNDAEITASQLEQVLGDSREGASPEVARRAVDSLVTEELLVQKALAAKLDRDPRVMQAIERARRQVLAQAFAERNVVPKALPSPMEIETYYRENPVLFEQRRIFKLATFTVRKGDMNAAVTAELDQAKTVEDLRRRLDAHGIAYRSQTLSLAPEQLPVTDLPAFSKAGPGDLIVQDQPNGDQMLVFVIGGEPSPVSLERARPMISQYLVNLRNRKAVEDYVARSRLTAKISYAPQYAAAAPPEQQADAAAK